MHLTNVPEEIRGLVYSVSASFLSLCFKISEKANCDATAVPFNVSELAKFSQALDRIIESAISRTELPSDVETTLQELEANHIGS